MADSNILKWRFDVNTFRLLGRELITDRITALFELVKNSYDANAKNVHVEFYDVETLSSKSKIIIWDDGTGMTIDDVRNKWMVVGTSSKRVKKHTDPPFNRRLIGEKGIGRFAVDKLGSHLLMKTKQIGQENQLCVEINWSEYEQLAKQTQLSLFTEVENKFNYENAKEKEHGTKLIIKNVNEAWSINDIERAYKELTKLVSPFEEIATHPFNIFVHSNEHESEYNQKKVKTDSIKYASTQFLLNYNIKKGKQEILKYDKTNDKLTKVEVPIKKFGPVRFRLFYFNENDKAKFKTFYKNEEVKIDGIKIYRDGIVTTPFAEFEAEDDKKRDILGIDKRKWSDTFNKVSTRNTIGVVDITKDDNAAIVDATNRQDFVQNEEYIDLKEFIVQQLAELEKYLKSEKVKKKVEANKNLKQAGEDVKAFSKAITQVTKIVKENNPLISDYLEDLEEKVKKVESSISKGIKEGEDTQKEIVRKENIYLSLMSLQDYAAHIAHAVRTSLGKVKQLAEFFKNEYPNAKYENEFKKYSVMIYTEMITLNKVIDFMLSYAGSDNDVEDFNVKDLIEKLFFEAYNHVFEAEGIKATVELNDSFIISGNKKFFEDIIQNLIANSIKALAKTTDKIIKCSGYIEGDKFIFYFSDNGYGIRPQIKDRIFEIYYTTTAEQGGAGIGLFIVRTRIEALNGTIEVVENEFKPTGATFKINLPLRPN